MDDYIIPIGLISEKHKKIVGGKAFSLARLNYEGFKVPKFFCLTAKAYREFLEKNKLNGQLFVELARKDFSKMRWEEMWDTSLRFKNMFLSSPIPENIENEIRAEIEKNYSEGPLVIRSSAPGEDSQTTSFAGIHESYVNIVGIEEVIEHIKLVWASLWSDAAILYRNELNLDMKTSSMAVIVQELIDGDRSGIVFSKDPTNESQVAIESVYGLNEGLVSGDIEPDRWILDRDSGTIAYHRNPSKRDHMLSLNTEGTLIEKLPPSLSEKEPLKEAEIRKIYEMAMISEDFFGCPQDMEWTISGDEFYLLQSRPITTLDDKEKNWYLSLRRSFENLKKLRFKLEDVLIPEMIEDAKSMSEIDLKSLNDIELADVIDKRNDLLQKWKAIYTKEFIPFAHGMRLFGEVYNEMVKPDDSHEFMELLVNSNLLSVQRNDKLNSMAKMIQKDNSLKQTIESGRIEGDFATIFNEFISKFGTSSYIQDKKQVLKLILELAKKPETQKMRKNDLSKLERNFYSKFDKNEEDYASELLEIGRSSYQLRDDDNIYLGAIEGHYLDSVREGEERIQERGFIHVFDPKEIMKALREENYVPKKTEYKHDIVPPTKMKIRQIQGQPASKGIVTGIARVIKNKNDLFSIKDGEILVCDAVEPNMTFVTPLISGIVERRGGMLIHGAIIAREYGIPCVTGIPDAIEIIETGDEVTVDGYLGIVVIEINKTSQATSF